ncbi:MAG: hypothetical protein L0H59_00525 [Tomitella sp.]|nr:hypothetical protein [Tomitella sp.]
MISTSAADPLVDHAVRLFTGLGAAVGVLDGHRERAVRRRSGRVRRSGRAGTRRGERRGGQHWDQGAADGDPRQRDGAGPVG